MKPGAADDQHGQPHASVGEFGGVGRGSRRFFSTSVIAAAVVLLAVVGLGVWYFVGREVSKGTVATTQQDKAYQQSEAELKQKLKSANTPQEKSDAYQDLANLHLERGDKATALKDAQSAVDSDKESFNAYATLAFIKQQAGDKEGAVAAYKKAAELLRAIGTPEALRGARAYEISAASVGK